MSKQRPPSLPGDRYGNLTLIKEAPLTKDGKRAWLCKCDCGREKIINQSRLRNGYTRSCGCYRSAVHRKDPGVASYNTHYFMYKRSARDRGFDFPLSLEEFKCIVHQSCNYCGASPAPYNKYLKSDMKTKVTNLVSDVSIQQATIYVNGIDRVDSSFGYIPENIVACCSRCNYAKCDMSVEEFNQWLDNLAKFRAKKKVA